MLLIANPKPCQVGSVFVLCPTVAMRSQELMNRGAHKLLAQFILQP